MTATMSKPTLETTIEGLVRLYYSNQASSLATSKAEVAISYWQRALREGIAAILFQLRGESLPRFNTIPLIYESDVNAILRKHEKDFVHGTPADKAEAIDAIYSELIEFAVPQELVETDEQERRRLVLAGEEPAKPGDVKWINDLVEERRQEADRLIAILSGTPVRQSKVNDADPHALHRCTMDECAHLPEHRRTLHVWTMEQARRQGKGEKVIFDGECSRCANSGVGACDDAPHPKRPESALDSIRQAITVSEAGRSKVDEDFPL